MSLWLESLCGWGGRPPLDASPEVRLQHARHVLSHLAMPVPRNWWQDLLDGRPLDDVKSKLMVALQSELSWALGGAGPSVGVLVALPFVVNQDDLGDIDQALAKAEQLLAIRTDLQALAHRLEFWVELGPQ